MRCVIYARYSTDRQTESSIEDQLRVCREYASVHGWEIGGEFHDKGISGAAMGNRPGAQGALATLEDGDALIVNDLSRLSRSQDIASLLLRLRHRGVRVIGVQDGFDSDARTARMQAGLSGIMSEEFRMMVADRTHSALEVRARDGRPTGGKAYADPVIVPEIFRRFADGESLIAIASDLNKREIPSPGANWKARSRPRGKWLVSTLHALLKNERYVGREVWNRSRWVKDPDRGTRHRRERPQSEWIVSTCEPLIDGDTWARAQARFKPNPGRYGSQSYILSGLLVCGWCNGRMIVSGGSQKRYICGTRHAGGDHACSMRHSVPKSTAEEYILEPVKRELLSPAAIAEGVKALRAARTQAEAPPAPPKDHEVTTLEHLVRTGQLSPEVAAPAIEAARARLKVQRAAPVEGLPWPTPEAWREAVEGMADILRGDDLEAARGVLRELVGEVRCTPEGEYLVAEINPPGVSQEVGEGLAQMAAHRVLLRTGSGVGLWSGSGGVLWNHRPNRVYMPISSRRRHG